MTRDELIEIAGGKEYVEKFFASRYVRSKPLWPYPDGIYDATSHYDDTKPLIRELIIDQTAIRCISWTWVENGGPEDAHPALKVPWGSYPPYPKKS